MSSCSVVDPRAVIDKVARRAGLTRRLALAGTGSALAAAAITSYVVLNGHQDDRSNSAVAGVHVPSHGLNVPEIVAPGTRCPGAVRGTPSEVAAHSDTPVWAPADATTISDAWRCGSTAVLMTHGVQVSYEAGYDGTDVVAWFGNLAEDAHGSVQTVHGNHIALFEPANSTHANNELMFVVDGTLVRLVAPGDIPFDRLVGAANSLDIAHPVK
jgi:hypothetical protein